MKCRYCRDRDVELLTRWERIRNWMFLRFNHVLFPEDLEDLIADKYTQGYSDGNTDGYRQAQYKRIYTKIDDSIYETKETTN